MKAPYPALVLALLGVIVACSVAQPSDNRTELQKLQQVVKGLDWHSTDFDAQTPIMRCRALMLLNHALEEIGAVDLAEADLMAEFAQKHGLSPTPSTSQPAYGQCRSFEDARKIAVALLKGPMAESSYATALADTDESGLKSYEGMYDKACRDKWSEYAEPALYVRDMAAQLKSAGKLKDYMAWVRVETERRQAEREAAWIAARDKAAVDAKEKEAVRAQEAEELARQREERTASRQAQQALYAAEQPAAASPGQTNVIVSSDEDDDDWYPGWYYGVVSNVHRPRPHHRDQQYQAEARARLNQHRDAGSGAPRARPGGRGRR